MLKLCHLPAPTAINVVKCSVDSAFLFTNLFVIGYFAAFARGASSQHHIHLLSSLLNLAGCSTDPCHGGPSQCSPTPSTSTVVTTTTHTTVSRKWHATYESQTHSIRPSQGWQQLRGAAPLTQSTQVGFARLGTAEHDDKCYH